MKKPQPTTNIIPFPRPVITAKELADLVCDQVPFAERYRAYVEQRCADKLKRLQIRQSAK